MTDVRAEVLATAKAMHASGLVVGTSGNVSGRLADGGVCLTPSSLAYGHMTDDDLVVVELDGRRRAGHRSPSTELALHLECYRRFPEVGGVVHSHAPHASMFAVAHRPVPAIVEEAVVHLGGGVPLCPYTPTGTDDLAVAVADRLADRGAVLMANHGLVAVGRSPDDALHVSLVAERTAWIAWGALALGGVVPLPEDRVSDFAGVYRLLRGD
jgi:L-fuculose-phosphate aldolase